MKTKAFTYYLAFVLTIIGLMMAGGVKAAGTTNTWDGSTSTDWSDGTNWSTNVAPVTGTDNVVIPTGLARYPVLTANSTCRTITSMGAGTSIGGNFTLTPSSNTSIAVTGAATISCNLAGAITYTVTGTGTLTLAGDNTFSSTLTISSGATLKLGATGGGTNTPLGTTAAGTTISSGATFDLNGFTLGTAEGLTISGTGVSSAGALTNTGGNASYSGAITLGAAATIEATTSGTLTLSGNISSSQILTLRGAGTGELSGVRSGTSTIVKNDAGTWILSNTNTYSGGTTVTLGTLQAGASTTVFGTGAGNITVSDGGTLDLNGFDVTLGSGTLAVNSGTTGGTVTTGSGTLTLGGNVSSTGAGTNALVSGNVDLGGATRSFTVTNAADGLTVSAIITGSFGVTKLGNGTLTLSGNSSYTGATTISNGIIKLGATGDGTNGPLGTTAGSTTISAGFSLDLNGFTLLTVDDISVAGTGEGTIGAITNTGGNATYSGNITLTNTTTFQATTSGTLTFSGDISGNFALTLRGAGDGELSGVRSGTSTIVKNDGGTWILSGASTYSGVTTITAGTLKLGASTSSSSAGPTGTNAGGITVASGAVFDLNGFSYTGTATDALSLTGTGISSLGALTNSSSTPSSYIGVITFAAGSSIVGEAGTIDITGIPLSSANGFIIGGTAGGTFSTAIAGARTLTKEGTGTWTLSGTNSYSLATTISAGTLKLNNTAALGTSSSTTVSNGAVLDLNGITLSTARPLTLNGTGLASSPAGALTNTGGNASYSGNITLGAAATITATTSGTLTCSGTVATGAFALTLDGATTSSGTMSGAISTPTSLVKDGTGTWILSGTNAYTGATSINAGTLQLNNTAALGTSSSTTVSSGAVLDLNGITLSTARPLTLNGTGLASSPAGALTNTGGNASYSGNITLGAAATITATTSGTLTCSGTVASGAFALTLDGATTSTGTMSGAISTPTSLVKDGTGTWILSGTNTYTGATSINAGTLLLNNTAALGTSSSTTVSSGAVLDLNGITLSTARPLTINGTGLASSPAGALTNTGGNASYSGNITLGAAATITATTSGTLTCSGTVATGAFALTLDGATTSNGTMSGIISTPTSLTKSGAGTWTLSAANSYSGGTTVSAGTLKLGAAGVVPDASALSVTGTFDLNGFSETVGSITGAGSITSTAAGTLTLTSGGDNSSTIWSGTISNGSATSVALVKNGSGALTLSTSNSYTGGTTLNAGSLNINHASALGASGSFTIAGGSIDNTSGADITTNNYTLSLNADFTYTGSVPRNLNLGTGAVTMSGSRQFTVSAGTLTIGGVINNNAQNITKAGSGTLSFGSQAVTVNNVTISAGTLTSTSNTLGIAGDFSNSGTFTHNSGTVDFNKAGAQNIAAATFNNLTCSGSGTKTATGNLVANGTLTVGSGIILDMTAAFTLTGTLGTISNSGTVRTSVPTATSSTPLAGGKTWNGTVNYAATTGLQTIASGTYTNLTMSNTSASNTMGGNVTIGGVFTMSGGKLSMGFFDLTLNGTTSGMTSSSSLTSNGFSSVLLGGSGALGTSLFFDQTTPGTTNKLANLTYNRSSATGGNAITLGNAVQVTGTVTPTNGELASGGNLTLISDALGTANVASGGCTTCSYITGNVNIQRFIPSVARRYRFIGSTVQSATLADWKSEIYITGSGGTANGFDSTASNAPSVYWYDETMITGTLNTGWTAATNITNSIVPTKGYRVFIRGDRSNSARLTGAQTDQNAVTLDLVGVPNQGNVTASISVTKSASGGTVYDAANDGWNMVSNPYPCGYNWNAHYDDSSTHTGIEPVIWVLSGQSGGYVSYNAFADAGSLSNGIIPAGASFWVKANNSVSPTLIFKEQYKITTSPLGIFKTEEGENFSMRLFFDSITYDDATVKYMSGSTANYDAYDIRKLAGTVTLSVYGNDNIHLDLSSRPVNPLNDTIKLYVSGAAGAYRLQFRNSNQIAVADNVWLFDTYLSTVTDLKVTNNYPFSIVSGVAASSGLNRFYIVVGNSSSMPVKLIQFNARKTNNKQVKLNWSTAQETNSSVFEVERSAEGKVYHTIATVAAGGNTHKLINYETLDEQPLRANYYRLKQVDLDGSVSYSAVQFVLMDDIAGASLYPIPALTTLTIAHSQPVTLISIIDLSGNRIASYAGAGLKTTIDVAKLQTGVYIIEYTDELGNTAREKFTKE